MKGKHTKNILVILSSIMLLGAFFKWPYSYFTLLRFVVCGSAAYVAYLAYEWDKNKFVWIFGIIAVLFNPIFKIHLDKAVWLVIDVATAVMFVVGMLSLKENRRRE